MDKKRIGVVFGGRSQEYEISLMSAGAVIKAARSLPDYQVVPLGISREGQWRIFEGKLEDLESDNWLTQSEHLELGHL